MKKLYTLILLATLHFSFAQDPQILNNTWYLKYITADGVTHFPPNPGMSLNFSSPTSFYTNACNTLAGTTTFENNFTHFSATDYTVTLEICQDAAAGNYQNTYFNFFGWGNGTSTTTPNNFTYSIVDLSGLLTLFINSEFNQQAVYSNVMLSNERFDKVDFSFYPNPAEDYIEINLNNTVANNTSIEIYNELGVLCKTANLLSDETRIDVRDLSSGIYFLKIKTGEGTTIKKLIKK
jgi:hypothetical protein